MELYTGLQIGREPEGGLKVGGDPRISRIHVTVRVGGTVIVEDGGSRNGTFVNGERVRYADLDEGDILRVGDTFFHFRHEGDTDDADVPLLVGRSPAARALRARVAEIGPDAGNVLLLGEGGTGKTRVAQALHAAGARPDGPLVAVDARELQPGAFFGPEGCFERARGGTVFIDAVGRLSPELQAELLQGAAPEVRLVAATGIDIVAAVRNGAFAGGLYARIAEHLLRVPPLRERREDILPVFTLALGDGAPPVEPDLVEALLTFAWPGNVRELADAAAEIRAAGQAKRSLDRLLFEPRIRAWNEQQKVAEANARRSRIPRIQLPPHRPPVPMPPKAEVEALLSAHDGNVTAAAASADRSRRQVYRWIKKYGLVPEDYR